MNALEEYIANLAAKANCSIRKGQIFAKVLTPNDDSGRHGVVIPVDVYPFFPSMEIPDPELNTTIRFDSFDAVSGRFEHLAYKYYQRYPERRITRVNSLINRRVEGHERLQIVIRSVSAEGSVTYIHDAANKAMDQKFDHLWGLFAGPAVAPTPGTYVVVPIDFGGFQIDAALEELLFKFDALRGDWHDSRRSGDTGVGYTFESLLGIKENNDQTADFKGIELKCKMKKAGHTGANGKLNLFQLAPKWDIGGTSIDRLKRIGRADSNGLYRCYSQVTTRENNLGLALALNQTDDHVRLLQSTDQIGHWRNAALNKRLIEKHSRAAFILAEVKNTKTGTRFLYDELVYCERPTIESFLSLVAQNQLVFEFTMSEKANNKVRNHGHPWRLIREEFLAQLFSVKIRLR